MSVDRATHLQERWNYSHAAGQAWLAVGLLAACGAWSLAGWRLPGICLSIPALISAFLPRWPGQRQTAARSTPRWRSDNQLPRGAFCSPAGRAGPVYGVCRMLAPCWWSRRWPWRRVHSRSLPLAAWLGARLAVVVVAAYFLSPSFNLSPSLTFTRSPWRAAAHGSRGRPAG